MNIFQKLRFLFSRSDDFTWLTDLDYRDGLTERVLQLVDAQPAPDWAKKVDLRTSYEDERKRPALTISQVHAVLTEAISDGHGSRPLAVGLAYQDGLLCGTPAVLVSGIVPQPPRGGLWGSPHLLLETNRSAVLLHRSTFDTAMKHEELKGPYT